MQEYLKLAVYPDVRAALHRLAGRKLAVLTNGSPDMIGPLVEHSGLRFDAVLSVDELKIYKPAPQVYELAVDRLKTPREKIGFVSSNCWDAIGARSFGFQVWWINRSGTPVDRMGTDLNAVISSLKDLPERLEAK